MKSKINNSSERQLIKGITSADDLEQLSKDIDVKIDGIYDINSITQLPPKGSFIILMRKEHNCGHWTAIHDNEYFDSFGVGPPEKLKIKKYSRFQYQGILNSYCGIWCLLFLYARQHDRPDLMRGFTDLDVEITQT